MKLSFPRCTANLSWQKVINLSTSLLPLSLWHKIFISASPRAIFGISGNAYSWIKSYFSSCSSLWMLLNSHESNLHALTCSIPQGSVLCFLLFSLHASTASKHISSSSVDHHLWADDIQIFIFFSLLSYSDTLNHLCNTITKISAWMTTNLLCLNLSETGLLIHSWLII